MVRLTVLRKERIGGYFKVRELYGIDASFLWRLEHGKVRPRPGNKWVKQLEEIFDMPLSTLLETVEERVQE